MAEVPNDLIYEVLKKIQDQGACMRADVHSIREELQAIRGHMNAMQRDIHNLYELFMTTVAASSA